MVVYRWYSIITRNNRHGWESRSLASSASWLIQRTCLERVVEIPEASRSAVKRLHRPDVLPTSSTCSSQVVTLCPREASLALCCVRKTATFPAATPEGPSSFHCSISKYYSLPLLFASPFSLILPIFLLSYATTVYRRSKWTTIDSSKTLNENHAFSSYSPNSIVRLIRASYLSKFRWTGYRDITGSSAVLAQRFNFGFPLFDLFSPLEHLYDESNHFIALHLVLFAVTGCSKSRDKEKIALDSRRLLYGGETGSYVVYFQFSSTQNSAIYLLVFSLVIS